MNRELIVNGVVRTVDCDAAEPLLDVLREQLDMVGTRFGCGLGACGACTVLLDGQPVTSCDLPVSAIGRSSVITVEGLDQLPAGSRLRAAFVTEQAAQCGYCVSGILIRAAALLTENDDLDEAAIRRGLDRHLCRCGTHNRFIRAVQRAATTSG